MRFYAKRPNYTLDVNYLDRVRFSSELSDPPAGHGRPTMHRQSARPMLAVACPVCGLQMRARLERRGQRGRCPSCRNEFVIGQPAHDQAEPVPA